MDNKAGNLGAMATQMARECVDPMTFYSFKKTKGMQFLCDALVPYQRRQQKTKTELAQPNKHKETVVTTSDRPRIYVNYLLVV